MEYVIQEQPTQQSPKWLPRLVVIGVIVLAVGYLFRWLTPDAAPAQPLSQSNYDNSQSTFENMVFTGTAPAIPSKLPVATATEVKRVNQEVELTLISKHRLQGFEKYTGIWIGPEYNLTRTSSPELYVLTKKAVEDATALESGISTEQAVRSATNYVSEVFKNEKFVSFPDRIRYFEIGDHPHPEITESEENANTIEISFGYKYGPYPVFFDKDYTFPVTIIVNSEYEIQKMTFQPYFMQFQEGQNFSTVTIQQALGNIMDGKGALIKSTYDGHGNPLLSDITKGSLSTVYVEYRVDSDSKTLLPYYRFTGQLENNEGITFYGEVVTPAIQTEQQ
jgi:hypothetical protein